MPVSSTNSTTRLEHCAWFAVFPSLFLVNASSCVKPWPNGLASRGKLKTWVYLRLRLARSEQVLPALRLICNDLRSLWSRSKLHARRCKIFVVWPPNPSQGWRLPFVHSFWRRMKTRSLVMGFLCDLRVLVRNLRVRLATQRKFVSST